MTDAAVHTASREIVVDEVFPHRPETIWKVLTDGALMARWMMPPTGFAPVEGTRFTFQTKPAGAWDGTIHCQVTEVRPMERLVYRWQGGHAANAGYGSLLDTLVTWTLAPAGSGTRVRVVHSGFELPRNETAYRNMSEGWKTVTARLDAAIGSLESGEPGRAS